MAEPTKTDEPKPVTKPADATKADDKTKPEETKQKKDEGASLPAPEPSQAEIDAIRGRAMTGAAAGGYKTR